jgi:2-polyprenyl-6-methoxyphenol hydroxylase-like FAD-dependent oxidoreductase
MASIVICGGSVIGLSVAIMLTADGHDVVVLEADPDPVPDSVDAAWATWRRPGVPQFRQPHNFYPRARQVLEAELPHVPPRLSAAGCTPRNLVAAPPPTIVDREPRTGDEVFETFTARRTTFEWVLAQAAQEQLDVRRGQRVLGLLPGTSVRPGVVHVAGVRTARETLPADLVIDATGRRSQVDAWLAELGTPPPVVESADSGFLYYTRYFTGAGHPEPRAPGLSPLGSISLVTIPSDNGTWCLTFVGSAGDTPLKNLRHVEVFDRVVRAHPLHAHWLDGEPLSDVLPMAGVLDRHRELVVDGAPRATGLLNVGDAWACTNPSAGRGISLGLMQAQLLRAAVAKHLDDADDLALAFHTATREQVEPYYRGQLDADRFRLAEMAAAREGAPTPPLPDPIARLLGAMQTDADAYRWFMETICCLATPAEILRRPDALQRILATEPAAPLRLPGPDREGLLALLS